MQGASLQTSKEEKDRMVGRMVGVELENSPTGPLWPPLNKLIIEVEMKILEKDMAILSYFPSKFIRTRSNTKI